MEPFPRARGVNEMNGSEREMAVADLIEDLLRLSALERAFLERWRSALATASGASQLVRVLDRMKVLASVEARAQRDRDLAIVAAIERVEFGGESPRVEDPGGAEGGVAQDTSGRPVEDRNEHGAPE